MTISYLSQVPSERLVSTAGATISKRRCSLDPGTADQLLFINKNMRDNPEFVAMSVGEVEESQEYMALVNWEQYQAMQAQAAALKLSHSQEYPPIFSKRPVQIPESDPQFEDLVRPPVLGDRKSVV